MNGSAHSVRSFYQQTRTNCDYELTLTDDRGSRWPLLHPCLFLEVCGKARRHEKETLCVSTGRPEKTSPGEHKRQTLERPDEQTDAAYWTRRFVSQVSI